MPPSLSLSANYSPSHPRYVRKLGKPQLLGDSLLKTETQQTRRKTTSTSETKMNTTRIQHPTTLTHHDTPVPRRRTCTSPTHAPRSHRHPGPHRNLLQVASSPRSS